LKPLKEMYGLSYDSSGFNSGLITWYNQLIDKTYENLTVVDVCKMIRQNILVSVAIKKSMELFLRDPYDGEYSDGGLLGVLASLEIDSLDVLLVDKLKTAIKDINQNYVDFEWADDETKNQYAENIDKMCRKLEMLRNL